jgi:two-component SAPR family response regulator
MIRLNMSNFLDLESVHHKLEQMFITHEYHTAVPIHIIYTDSFDLVRHSITTLLKMCGNLVSSFASAFEMLEHLKELLQNDIQPDIVIIDPFIHDIQNNDIAVQVKSIFPNVKVIYFTGHGNYVRQQHNEPGVDLILLKPMSAKDLDAKVRYLHLGTELNTS